MTEEVAEGVPLAEPEEGLTKQEDADLVALLSAKPEKARAYLPTRNEAGETVDSERYFIEMRPWTAAQHLKYTSVGMEYSVTPPKQGEKPVLHHKQDPVKQAQALLEETVTDFLLPSGDGDVKYAGRGSVWVALSARRELLTWAVSRIRTFHGIEVVDTSGEASEPAS
jgi:hypothetical protein